MSPIPVISTDAVVAVSQVALNKGWAKMFGDEGVAGTLKLEGDDWELADAKVAPPQISFLPSDQSRARLTIRFVAGEYVKERWNKKKKEVVKRQYDLADKHLSFDAMLNRMEMPDFHDSGFTAQALYLDLTNASNIDALSMGFDSDDLASIGEVLKGLVEKLQEGSGADHGLFIGRIRVPKTPDTAGPLAPTAAALAASCAAEHPDVGELDFLLMTRGRQLPSNANEQAQRGFPSPIVQADGAAGHDAALVLSDRSLLESIAIPVLEKAFEGIKLALSGPDANGRSVVRQAAALKLPERGMSAENAHASLEVEKIHITVDLNTRERLQTEDGPKGVDFSLVEVILKKTLTYDLKIRIDDDGLLTFELKEGPNNGDDPKPEFKTHFEVHGIKDIPKYIIGPGLAAIAGPLAVPIVATFITAIEGLAIGIQTGIVDVLELNKRGRTGLGSIENIDTHLELPGDPVFLFAEVTGAANSVLVGADYVDPPELQNGSTDPYAIKPFPKVKVGERMPPDRTEPELIGEVALKYRYVRDPRFDGANRRNMPYYILRREQFWHRVNSKNYPAQSEESMSIESIVKVASTHEETMTETLSMDVSASGTLQMLEGFAPELKVEFKNELEVKVEDKVEREQTDTIKHEVKLNARDQPFGISVWVLRERYTLMRTDRSIVNQWDFANADYVHIDDYLLAQTKTQTEPEETEP